MPADILITGDLVLDHHLYEGDKPSPGAGRDTADRKYRPLKEVVEWGGANLLCRLLNEVEKLELADAREADEKAEQEEAKNSKSGEAGKAKEVKSYSPQTSTSLLYGTLPLPLPDPSPLPVSVAHGYALFTLMEHISRDNPRVWRVSKVLGYADSGKAGNGVAGKISSSLASALPASPQVICLDDAGDEFRNYEDLWRLPSEEAASKNLPWIVLKLSGDLEYGNLWSALEKRKDLQKKLVIIVAAEQLRNMNVRLSNGLSWERSVEHLLSELVHHPVLLPLKKAHHLIVHFTIDAAVWIKDIHSDHPQTLLVFDAANAEGEWAETFTGTAFAFQTCLAAAVCRDLAIVQKNGTDLDISARAKALGAGLSAMRRLRSDGHGPEFDEAKNIMPPKGFPVSALARELLKPSQSFSHVVAPDSVWKSVQKDPNSGWTILGQTQSPHQSPLYGLARQIVLRGEIALNRLPHLRIEKLLTAQRADMESLRSLRRLFNTYKSGSNPGKKPLSIGVFGPPGAGKSFAVKELTLGMFAPGAKEYAGWKEFNLSQFDGIEDLIGAFHQVRDLVLQRLIPVVFWDEFDSSNYKWLQYLLAPMQDGRFQQGEATHTIGKCIFIFAGGTAWTFDSFGEFSDTQAIDQFRLAKGPDFKSRLDGVYNVLGPNQNFIPPKDENGIAKLTVPTSEWKEDPEDIYFPIRRAILIRGLMGLKPDQRTEFDPGLLTALLQADSYIHGARSMEKVVESLRLRKNLLDQPLTPVRAALPAPGQLRLYVKTPEKFHSLCSSYLPPFVLDEELVLRLAEAIHEDWRKSIQAERQLAERQVKDNGKPWNELSDEDKKSNVAAASRIPEVLSLVGLKLVPGKASAEEDKEVRDYLALHLDLLAEDEHERWMAHERSRGIVYGEKRDETHHPCMKPFQQLPAVEQDKDRDAILHYPDRADLIGYKISFVESPEKSNG